VHEQRLGGPCSAKMRMAGTAATEWGGTEAKVQPYHAALLPEPRL
jgi:hypothetical protein